MAVRSQTICLQSTYGHKSTYLPSICQLDTIQTAVDLKLWLESRKDSKLVRLFNPSNTKKNNKKLLVDSSCCKGPPKQYVGWLVRGRAGFLRQVYQKDYVCRRMIRQYLLCTILRNNKLWTSSRQQVSREAHISRDKKINTKQNEGFGYLTHYMSKS